VDRPGHDHHRHAAGDREDGRHPLRPRSPRLTGDGEGASRGCPCSPSEPREAEARLLRRSRAGRRR
jgi:hypothetical protein